MDPHDEYIKHSESPDFGKKNRDRYDSEVFFTDLHVGRLLDWAEKQAFWENTAIIVSADHGEAFGEHGLYKHAFWLWDVITRVPLFVHAPGAKPRRIDLNRSHIDIAPTILDLAGVKEKPEAFMGRSLVPEIYGTEPPDIRDPVLVDLPEDSHNPPVRAMVRGNKKLIAYGDRRFEVYDLETDPGEETDLSKTEPDLLADLRAEYQKIVATLPIVAPYGGNKLREGGKATGPMGPAK
jgi:arylsulfatase A-like enzyme